MKSLDILEIKKNILEGNTILYPTDTIWGIGCDATNHKAIESVYELKKRPESKSFIVLFSSIEMIKNYLKETVENLNYLIETNYPTTFIVDYNFNLPFILLSSLGTLAIRIPKNDICIKMINEIGRPLVSTSANFSGEKTPLSYKEITNEIIQKVAYRIPEKFDSGTGKPSAIIQIVNREKIIIRD